MLVKLPGDNGYINANVVTSVCPENELDIKIEYERGSNNYKWVVSFATQERRNKEIDRFAKRVNASLLPYEPILQTLTMEEK